MTRQVKLYDSVTVEWEAPGVNKCCRYRFAGNMQLYDPMGLDLTYIHIKRKREKKVF